ncbi:MAG: hypothetical protein QM730_21260 [Anaerolineales bacterium]
MAVYILDQYGSPVPGIEVTFTAPVSGPSGVFTDSGTWFTHSVTNGYGIASSSTFTANDQFGHFAINASITGLANPVSFNFTNIAWYVSPTGNNYSICNSKATPCLTINKAIERATATDTIYVGSGVYTGASASPIVSINKNIILSGGWNSNFTNQTGMSVIDGQNSRGNMYINKSIVSSLNHFILRNGKSNNGSGIYNMGDITISNSSIHSNAGGGIYNNSGIVKLNQYNY